MQEEDAAFAKKLLLSFAIEAQETLRRMSAALLALESERVPEAMEARLRAVAHEIHGLKGSARAVNEVPLHEIAQGMEEVIARWKESGEPPARAQFDLLLNAVDWMQARVAGGFGEVHAQEAYASLLARLGRRGEAPRGAPSIHREPLVEVSSKRMERLLRHIEELLVIKSGLAESARALDASVRRSSGGGKRLREIAEAVDRDSRLASSMIDLLLDETKGLLMAPISSLLLPFPRMVRDLGHALEKEVVWKVAGEEMEMDRRILAELKDPLIQLVRNGMDHGIESPEERVQAGKPRAGTLTLTISGVGGSHAELRLSDDGRGFDLEAIQRRLAEEGQAASQGDVLHQVVRLGLSTRAHPSELSGRGVGLGVACDRIARLGGRIALETAAGKGSVFVLRIPLVLAAFRGILVTVGEKEFLVPTQSVSNVWRLADRDVQTAEAGSVCLLHGSYLPLVCLGAVLGSPASKERATHVLVVEAGGTRVAFSVDRIVGEQEVFVKPLDPALTGRSYASSAAILEGERVVPILDPVQLIAAVVQAGRSL
jgi:two-component system chemotaxis sensor kinase CheA